MSAAMGTRTTIAIVIGVIVAAVTAGLFALGSPARARERRFDIKRVEHLAQLNMSVNSYYASSGHLPAALSDLQQETGYTTTLRDPASAEPYEYRVIDGNAYELCATFQQAAKGASRKWQHGAGRHCFKHRPQNKDW